MLGGSSHIQPGDVLQYIEHSQRRQLNQHREIDNPRGIAGRFDGVCIVGLAHVHRNIQQWPFLGPASYKIDHIDTEHSCDQSKRGHVLAVKPNSVQTLCFFSFDLLDEEGDIQLAILTRGDGHGD
nr:hypothetical protein KPSA3_100001 [Pseudomonas syringae pv. actinidiae]